jgi:hypothetical protein
MKKEQLKRIFDFLEEKENCNPPLLWKLRHDIPLIEDDLNIEGDLDLHNSNITSLPEGLKVMGNLLLFGSAITSLPEGLKIGGDLYLRYTSITLLPKGLKLEGDLFTRGSKLEKLSDDELREMIKPGYINGNIY